MGLLVSNADLRAGAAKKDEDALQGTWQVVSATFNGKTQPQDEVKDRKLVFRGRQFTAVVGGKEHRAIAFTLDPGHKPRRIDLKYASRDQTAQGVYRLKGDQLELCYGEPGSERPTGFASDPGSRVFLLVLRRAKR
jgi:uncharacterized protein (TIGR03067 family)